MPNLRSVIAQVHGKSRSIGSHRSFSTSSPTEYEEALARARPYAWVVTRSIGVVIGYCSAAYYFGDLVARYENWLVEDLREKAKSQANGKTLF